MERRPHGVGGCPTWQANCRHAVALPPLVDLWLKGSVARLHAEPAPNRPSGVARATGQTARRGLARTAERVDGSAVETPAATATLARAGRGRSRGDHVGLRAGRLPNGPMGVVLRQASPHAGEGSSGDPRTEDPDRSGVASPQKGNSPARRGPSADGAPTSDAVKRLGSPSTTNCRCPRNVQLRAGPQRLGNTQERLARQRGPLLQRRAYPGWRSTTRRQTS